MDDKILRRLQLTELELLMELHRVCVENDIEYVIAFGTMLGSVRHKGFIPWDDDADVVMTRENYERFRSLRGELNPEIAYFQDHDTDPSYIWGYGKLRRTGTKYIRAGQEHVKANTGIFIDIFPMDGIPKTHFGCIMQDIRLYFIRKALWARVGYKDSHGIVRLGYWFLKRQNVDSLHARLFREAKKYATSDRVRIYMEPSDGKKNPANTGRARFGWDSNWISNRSMYEFEGLSFYGTRDGEAVLSYLFGDYMTPPPPEERTGNSPATLIVFPGEQERPFENNQ